MLFPWQRHEADLKRELEHHLAELTDEYIRRGHSEADAHHLARKQFGAEELIKERCRDESPWAWLETMGQDIRFGYRQLRLAPVVTAAAVLSLALGIGANSAIISLMNTILWRSLPVAAPEQLSLIHWEGSGFPDHLASSGAGSMFKEGASHVADFFPLAAVDAMRQAGSGKAEIAEYSFSQPASISFAGRPIVGRNRPVGGNFFETLRVQAYLGRTLRPEDNQPAAAAVAVVSHAFFKNFFSADPTVIGQTLRINNAAYEIVGVLPESFFGLTPGDPTQIYSPIWKSSEFAIPNQGKIAFNDPREWVLQILARRKEGVTESALRPLLDAAFAQSWQRTKNAKAGAKDPMLRLDDGRRGLGDLSRSYREPLLVLGALLALVLLIACANIANLLLARSTARAKEVALRMSLGCTRGRLLRQFLTESGLLALLGGVASIGVAFASAKGLAYFLADRDSEAPLPFSLDLPMLAAIFVISILTLFLFGLFPAWRASSLDSNAALKEGAGSLGAAARRWWTPGRLLVVGQMALSIILISCAVLFTENLRALAAQDTGFDRRNLLVFGLRPGTSGYTAKTLPGFYAQLEQRLTTSPGVESASLATIRPMNQGGWWDEFREVGQSKPYSTAVNAVTPSYLPQFAFKLKAGRNFRPADLAPKAPKVAIISEDLARAIDPVGDLIGRRIHSVGGPGSKIEPIEIIGVAPAFAFNSMKERPQVVWLPFNAEAQEATVVIRTKSNPRAVLASIRAAVQELDRNLPMVDVYTMEELVARNLKRERMFATLCGSIGLLALLLSVVGLYGVMSYNASRRRTEIGVRLALGAERQSVIWLVLKEALFLTMLGLAAGAPAIYYGSRFLEKELFNLKPLDPVLIAVSTLLLAGSATFAAWLPAQRAASLDPATALRQD